MQWWSMQVSMQNFYRPVFKQCGELPTCAVHASNTTPHQAAARVLAKAETSLGKLGAVCKANGQGHDVRVLQEFLNEHGSS